MIRINEAVGKKVKLTNSDALGILMLVGDDAKSGIVEAKAIEKKIGNSGYYDPSNKGSYNVSFDNGDIEYLEYWKDLLVNHPTSPSAKYMDSDSKSAIKKLFNL